MPVWWRLFLKVLPLFLGLLLLWNGSSGAEAAAREAYVARVDGVINPIAARYVLRHLKAAEERGAEVFILTMDTPGGLDTSMRAIVQGLLNTKVPTVVFVSPKGARAASAGVFILAAANVAAMAPGTNLGAASPVALGGELPETLEKKATNDAAAYLREIAYLRGRNADWLEDTVRKATSAPATDALKLGAIDLIAEDMEQLLKQLDGRTVTIGGAQRTLGTAFLVIVNRPMTLIERVLDFVSDPNIATLLISIGSLALISELFHTSLIAGMVGALMLALGFMGLGNLPVNWVGVALILAAALLLTFELLQPGWGVLGVSALVAFVVGALLLFSTYEPSLPDAPKIRVSLWVIAGLSAVAGLFLLYIGVTIRESRRRSEGLAGTAALVGKTGVVTSDLSPVGTVQLESEVWSAKPEEAETIPTGVEIRVVRVEGLVLRVRRAG